MSSICGVTVLRDVTTTTEASQLASDEAVAEEVNKGRDEALRKKIMKLNMYNVFYDISCKITTLKPGVQSIALR